MSIDPVAPLLGSVSAIAGAIAIVSLAVGKAPYQDILKRNYIVRRKWEPGRYWVSITFFSAICIITAFAAAHALFRS